MACCGNRAIPKTSSLGTYFFAHARRGDCTSAPESREHLLAKTIVAKSAQAAGWTVTTEAPGRTPEGDQWTADVMCQRGDIRVAIEIQWSHQSLAEYRARQERYDRSGVRTSWLVKRLPKDPDWFGDARSTHELPMFTLAITEGGTNFTATRDQVPLNDFITDLLRGNLHYGPRPGVPYDILGVLIHDTCWRCAGATNLVGLVEIRHPKFGTLGRANATFDGIPELLQSILPHERRAQLRLGSIRPRYSRTVKKVYVSQGCAHCDALLGAYFIESLVRRLEGFLHQRKPMHLGRCQLDAQQARHFHATWRYG